MSTQAAGDVAAQAAAALYDGIRTETLANGLRVFLKPIANSPVVTTMVAYKVGSADENLQHTGLSHYLEHLMFKGTDKIKPGYIDRLTLRNGGANNAFTSEDYTIYYFDFAADRWEAALDIDADRMRNLRIDAEHEFEQEKGAVISELQRNEDQPWDLEQKAILPLLFGKKAPYGHPVIGERAHVRGATAAVIKAHYDQWYYPNNAALVICGGFDPDQARAKIKKLFGALPKATLPPRPPAQAVRRDQPLRRQIDSRFDVARMLMGFNTVRIGEPDFYPLEVLQAVLSGGKTSRLYKKLVEGEEIAGEVGSSNGAGRYPGWFSIQVQLLKGKDRGQAEELVLAELKRLRDEPISAAELKRVQRQLLASAVYDRESVHGLADSIARGVTTNDLDFLKTYLPRVLVVTARDVQQVARKYFDPEQRVVVWSVPRNGRGDAGKSRHENAETLGRGDVQPTDGPHRSMRGQIARSPRSADEARGGQFSLQGVRREVLPNGLTLLLFENHRLPIVVAGALVRDVRLLEPDDKAGVATLTGRLLDEGTPKHTGPEIAELIENVGGSLSFSSSGATVRVLAPDRSLGLSLLFECLSAASFPEKAFARQRQRLLSEIDDAERQPEVRAQIVYRAQLYGKHPYGRPNFGRRAAVKNLSRDDCVAFHRRLFMPNNTVVAVVGDFDTQKVREEITRLTAGWKRAEVPRPELPPIEQPGQFKQKMVTMPDAAQLHFYMGHIGIRRRNPDYFKLLVMDYVLGTGPGFTDRLSARLRDREGLAYTVMANITQSAAEEPGPFTCYIGTDPKNFGRVKKMFLEELERIRKEPPKPEEVEDAKKYLLGSMPFQFTTNASIAGQLLAIERFHLGFHYLDDYRKQVAEVTPEDVESVARKYLHPKQMVLVAAGAVDQDGRPLGRLPPPAEPPEKKR